MADFASIIGGDLDFEMAWLQQSERAGFVMEYDAPDQQAEIEARDLGNPMTELEQQFHRAEVTLTELHPVALQYAQYAARGICSHDSEVVHQAEFVQAPLESDPAPIRVGSLRYDYYTAPPEDVDAAAALMGDDTLPPQEQPQQQVEDGQENNNDNNAQRPVWRPEYDVCVDDLAYHVNMYTYVPPARALALHLFKQCLISFVPRPTNVGGPASRILLDELVFSCVITQAYRYHALRPICARFAVWVVTRCGPQAPQRDLGSDFGRLFACVRRAEVRCPAFRAGVAAAENRFHAERPWIRARLDRERRAREQADEERRAFQQRRWEEVQRRRWRERNAERARRVAERDRRWTVYAEGNREMYRDEAQRVQRRRTRRLGQQGR